ncbi:hypothetical protein LCGC14_2064120, partial [marine sediment metagenome]
GTVWAGTGDFDGGDLSAAAGVTVTFQPDNVGSGTVTADDPGLAGTPDDATGTLTVGPGGISYIAAATDLGGNAEAGVPFSVIITAYDADNNVKTDFTGLHNVTWLHTAVNAPDATAPVIPGDGNQTFNSGIATVSGVVLVNAEAGVTITPTVDGTYSDATPNIDVDAGLADYFTVVTGGAGTETAGTAFTLTITVMDNYGNVVGSGSNDYDGIHDINFYSSATDAPDGTTPTIPVQLSLTFVNGVVTSGALYTLVNAGETPTITAEDNVDTSVTGTASGVVVNDAGLSIVRVNGGAGGNTAEVSTYSMTADDSLVVHASQYDAYMNYIGDSPVGTVWAGTGDFDGGDLSAAAGVTVTFQPDNVGSGTVTADDPGLAGTPDDATGLITVNPGVLSYVLVTDSPGGTEIATPVMTTDDELAVYSSGYDADFNYIGLESVNWSVDGNYQAGDLSVLSGTSSIFRPDNTGTTGVITANHATATDDTTGDITVNVGVLDYIVIEDLAGGAGSAVTTQGMTTDDTLQVWAAGYDGDGNYISDISSVTWGVTGSLDPTPAGPAISTIFDPITGGTSGTITADDGGGHTDETSTIMVNIGTVSYMLITDTPGGTEVDTAGITTDDTLTLYASGYDAGDTYIGPVSVTWGQTGTLSPVPGGTSTSYVYDPDAPGSGTIDADHATATDDSTGTITVNVGAESYVVITTTLG